MFLRPLALSGSRKFRSGVAKIGKSYLFRGNSVLINGFTWNSRSNGILELKCYSPSKSKCCTFSSLGNELRCVLRNLIPVLSLSLSLSAECINITIRGPVFLVLLSPFLPLYPLFPNLFKNSHFSEFVHLSLILRSSDHG